MEIAQAQFALDLVQQLSPNATNSLVVSPLSVILALSMAYLGSGGETTKEFQERFGVNATTEPQLFNHLGLFVKDSNSFGSLFEAWNHGYAPLAAKIETPYQLQLLKTYGSLIEHLYYGNRQFAVNKINKDVELHTHGKVKDMVEENMLNDDAILLVNTLYLEAEWYNTFESSKSENFSSFPDSYRQIDMMHLKTGVLSKGCRFAENTDFQLLRLPYKTKRSGELADLYFNLLLPKERFGLGKAMEQLNGTELLNMFGRLETRDFVVEMPSFKLETKEDLKEVLPQMGFELGFSDNADFTQIVKNKDYRISNTYHWAKIEVDKQGTKAVAATIVRAIPKSMFIPYKLTHIRADHPFMYLITNKRNDVLFAGVYN